jgi:WD40 repeat protein
MAPAAANSVQLWDDEFDAITNPLEQAASPVISISWAPDSERLAAVAPDGTIWVWTVESANE